MDSKFPSRTPTGVIDRGLQEFEKRFRNIHDAAGDHNHVLVAHMWEGGLGDQNAIDTAAIIARHAEADSVLNVIAGNAGRNYFDGKKGQSPGYLGDFPTRDQDAIPGQPMIGLATSPISSSCNLQPFDNSSKTGLLLLDVEPVYVSPHDAWSTYYQSVDRVPDKIQWDDFIQSIIDSNPEIAGKLGHYYKIAADKSKRDTLAGKFGVLKINWEHELADIIRDQLPEGTKGEPSYLTIDPIAESTVCNARTAYTKMMNEIAKKGNSVLGNKHPEVDVNVSPADIAGIMAYFPDNGTQPFIEEQPSTAVEDVAKSAAIWKNALANNTEMAKTLYRACLEYKQLNKTLYIKQKPTIVIYQPNSQGFPQLIHFPPTIRNMKIVSEVLSEKGLLPPHFQPISPYPSQPLLGH